MPYPGRLPPPSETVISKQQDGQVVYRSNVRAPAVPNDTVWDFLFRNIQLDDARIAFEEVKGKKRALT